MSKTQITFILLLCLDAFVTVHAAELLRAGDNRAGDNEYIVVLSKDKTRNTRDVAQFSETLTRQYGLIARDEIHIGNFDAIFVEGDEEHITGVLDNPDIDYIEENKVTELDEFCWESNKITQNNWGVHRIGRRSKVPVCSDPNCVYKYGSDQDGQGVYVYVLDTGIRLDHDQFNGRAVFGKQFLQNWNGLFHPKTDLHGHGTHVAGIAIGKEYGVARGAMAVSVQIMDRYSKGTASDVLKAVEWAHNDIKNHKRKAVINMSLSVSGNSRSLNDEIKAALAEGTPFVVAAGNQAKDACLRSPAMIGKTTDVITVGATDITDQLIKASNYGDCVSILGPGGKIHAAGIYSRNTIAEKSGTSMAAPHVAGVIARYLSGLTNTPSPASIKNWLLQSATPDAITLPPQASNTPNKLLYMDCTHAEVNNTPPIMYRKVNACANDHTVHMWFP